MSAAPLKVTLDNPADWDETARELAAHTGTPTQLTPQVLLGMVAGAVPLLFAADANRDMDPLRGIFTDPVIAQCDRNAGCLEGVRPLSVEVSIIGAIAGEDGLPGVRLRLTVPVEDAGGRQLVYRQFWDVEVGAQVTVAQESQCPGCGAPVGPGELLCGHCGQDLRAVAHLPLAVSQLQL